MPKKRSSERQKQIEPSAKVTVTALPPVTHLQFLVMDFLFGNKEGLSAQQLMDRLGCFSTNYTGPKFYQLMGRLADAGLVVSWSQDFDVGGTLVQRTFYRLNTPGESALRVTVEFYKNRTALQALFTIK